MVAVGAVMLVAAGMACAPQAHAPQKAEPAASSAPGEPEESAKAERARGPNRPNVIWILLDACRARNLSCYGNAHLTSPNIDALAAQGLLMEQHYAQGCQTHMSVPSYMTGRYFPTFCLGGGSWREGTRIAPPDEHLLPRILRENGYYTALFSAHAWIGEPDTRLAQAFDECHRLSEQVSFLPRFAEIEQNVSPWLEHAPRAPFFLYIHAVDTHFPHHLEAPYDKWLPKVPTPGRLEVGSPGHEMSGEERAFVQGLHDGSILYADERIGQIVDKLRASGLYDNTILIVGADHGDLLGEDGQTMGHPEGITADELLHVPLVMAGPGIPRGRITGLTENVDVVPTLVELLQLNTSARMDGTSLLQRMSDPSSGPPRGYVVSRAQDRGNDEMPCLAIRDEHFKYELNSRTGERHLWAVPDSFGARVDRIAEEPQEAAQRQQRIEADLIPLWRAYEALPRSAPGPFEELFGDAYDRGDFEPKEAISFGATPDPGDNKWALTRHVRGELMASPWREQVPPITFHIAVPAGTYHISINVLAGFRDGHRAGCVALKAEGDTEFRTIRAPESDWNALFAAKKDGYRMADVGTYVVEDGVFDVTLAPGDPEWFVAVTKLRFVPGSGTAESSATSDQIRALGYVD